MSQHKPWQKLTVAITGMNNKPDNPGPGYAVARCIHEHAEFEGTIIGLGYDVLDGGLYHHGICDHSYLLPYPSSGEQALLDRLLTIQNTHPIDVLIPCLDAELAAFSRLRPMLNAMGIQVLLPSVTQIQRRNKDRLPELCDLAQISTPRTVSITSPAFFYECHTQGWQYPLVVKGCFYDAAVVHNTEQATTMFQKIAAEWGVPILVQQFIPGEEFNLTALGDGQGGLIGAVTMRKRALTDKGKAWAGLTIDEPAIMTLAQRLIKALRWEGPLEVELLRDQQGQFHLIEVNPRFPAWIYLSHGAGCNLPVALLQQLNGVALSAIAPPKVGQLFIRYAEELVINLEQFEQLTMHGTLSKPDTATATTGLQLAVDNTQIA